MQKLLMKLGKSDRVIVGGPYREKPLYMVGVKMAAEIKAPCEVSIPTKDFSVPSVDLMQEGIKQTLPYLALRQPVYVGCMGGLGRTGLFMACLAKVLGYPYPISHVRQYYNPHAVETSSQEDYVQYFPHEELQKSLWKFKVVAWIVDRHPPQWVMDLLKSSLLPKIDS